MSVILLAKRLRALYPVDESGEDWLRRLAQGEIVEATVRRPRNAQFHRLFWALASLCWEQTSDREKYPNVEAFVTELKIVTGHYDRRDIVVDGKHYPVLTPRSISFATMDDDGFAAFFERCADHIVREVLPGVRREDIREQIEQMTDAKVGAGVAT